MPFQKNIESIYFPLNTDFFDHYGFLKNKLIIYHTQDPAEIKKIIDDISTSPSDTMGRAKRYDALINTPFYGKSQELYSNVINALATGNFEYINSTFEAQDYQSVKVYTLR